MSAKSTAKNVFLTCDQCADSCNSFLRLRDLKKPSQKGWKCDYCHELAHLTSTWKRDQNVRMKDRASIHEQVHNILCNPEDNVYNSISCKAAINRILKTNDRFLTSKRLALRRSCFELKACKTLVIPKEK